MSDATTHLLLPYILAAQAQKHVTHNEALRLLDGLDSLDVLDGSQGVVAAGHRVVPSSSASALNPRSRRLLVTTNTLDNAMAAPAIIGFSRPAAAIGIAATL